MYLDSFSFHCVKISKFLGFHHTESQKNCRFCRTLGTHANVAPVMSNVNVNMFIRHGLKQQNFNYAKDGK